ncbi:MAG: UDP-N-acetylglucosamine pyrophosphorylase [Deltaproteobacteria bacterium]|nr:UDP-N-acetylglucosamine pyrophosphorylase [Deltaproteobacteria bacterium]
METKTAIIILAAGQGKRMRSNLPKPLVPVAGRPIIDHLIDAVRAAKVSTISVVVGHQAERMRSHLDDTVHTPLQSVRNGTAHAVDVARDTVSEADEVFVFVGDSPLISTASIDKLQKAHRETGAACSFLTADFAQHYPYARVIRDPQGSVTAVIEERDCTPEQTEITEYLTSHFLFDAAALWSVLDRIETHPVTGERYLTDAIGLLLKEGARVEAVSIEDWRELVGLNTPEDVAWAETVIASV